MNATPKEPQEHRTEDSPSSPANFEILSKAEPPSPSRGWTALEPFTVL